MRAFSQGIKWLLAALLPVAVVFGCFRCIDATIYYVGEQPKRDQIFFQTRLLPVADFVKKFRIDHGRLPAQREFRKWAQSTEYQKSANYFSMKPKDFRGWGEIGSDFMIGIWRGEWFEYYQSWDGRVFPSDEPLVHDDKDR